MLSRPTLSIASPITWLWQSLPDIFALSKSFPVAQKLFQWQQRDDHPHVQVDCYTSATAIPAQIWKILQSKPRQANIILFSALRILEEEKRGDAPNTGQLWLVCRCQSQIDFILSCTDGPMGAYPICIFTPHPHDQITSDFCLPRLTKLAQSLAEQVDSKRVFSVFAFETVTRVFAHIWQELTGLQHKQYYAAKQSYCTQATIRRISIRERDHEMRLALTEDIPCVATLCYGFARDSDPFVLSREGALKEAAYLVAQRKVWVHVGKRPGAPDVIASIVAVTRESGEVSAITKVFTSPEWRRMGCAKRLVTFVCEELLQTKKSVVLYVGHSNTARSIYARIGFVGLDDDGPSVPGVDNWLELGFEKDKVNLGHW